MWTMMGRTVAFAAFDEQHARLYFGRELESTHSSSACAIRRSCRSSARLALASRRSSMLA